MQAYYRSVLGHGGTQASPEERQALRRAMIDYGALQPSPVQNAADTSKSYEPSYVATSVSPTLTNGTVRSMIQCSCYITDLSQQKPYTNLQNQPFVPPLTTARSTNGYQQTYSWNSPTTIPPLEEDDTFNLDSFDLSNAELEEMMMNATQDFWASFPGEVGVGFQ